MALESNRGARRPHSAGSDDGWEQIQPSSSAPGGGSAAGNGDTPGEGQRRGSPERALESRWGRLAMAGEDAGDILDDGPAADPSPAGRIRQASDPAGGAKMDAGRAGSAADAGKRLASPGGRGVPNAARGRGDAYGAAARRTVPSGKRVKAAPLRPPYEGMRAGERAGQPHNIRHVNAVSASEEELELERRIRKNKQKGRRNRFLLMAVVEIVTLVFIVCASHVVRYMSLTQNIEFDVAKVKNPNIDIQKQKQMEGYWTVVVFGVDSRDGTVGRGANADVQIIANIDMGNGDIKLVSVYRDSYMNLGNGTRYAKINEAYAAGGPEQAVSALNKNLDLDIENYVTFNWKAVADAISMIGGVDLDITEREFYYMNAFIHETCLKSGISEDNPAAEYIAGPGMQHLDGVQTVAYARLRYMDDDFERTRRQRNVISQVLDKSKKTNLATLTQIIDTVFPQVATNVDMGDVIQLARGVARYNIKEAEGFPQKLKTQMMGKKGDCVIPVTLASNVTWLHAFLFEDEEYDPSSAVWTYSQKIADDSAYYKNGGDSGSGSSGKKAAEESTAWRNTEPATEAVRTSAAETTRAAGGDEDDEERESSASSTSSASTSRSYDDDDEDEDYTTRAATTSGSQRPGDDADEESSRPRETSTAEETRESSSRSGGGEGAYERDDEGNYRDSDGYIVPTDRAGDPAYGNNNYRESTEAASTAARQTEEETQTHAPATTASPVYDDGDEDSAGPGGGTTEAEMRPGGDSGAGSGQVSGGSPGGDSAGPGGDSPGADSPGGGGAADSPAMGGEDVIIAEGPGA